VTTINGACAAITGAAGGIGAGLARRLAAQGCDLALADIKTAELEDLAKELRAAHGRAISVHAVDVARREQVDAFAAAAIAKHPRLNIVVNNAGVALFGMLHELELADIEWLMGINFWGVVHGTQAFLPHLQKQPEAHIVNVSSIFGIIAPPGQTAYCAAKFAVRGFSESLRHELQTMNSKVHLSVVHPGGVDTGISQNSRVGARMTDNARRAESLDRFAALPKASPTEAADRIIAGILKNEPRILIGKDARRMDILQRLRPGTYWAAIAKRIEKMTGRKMSETFTSKTSGEA
jgi:short-subunit dehydrogenase